MEDRHRGLLARSSAERPPHHTSTARQAYGACLFSEYEQASAPGSQAPFLREMPYAALDWRPGVELPPIEGARAFAIVRLGYVDLAPDDENRRMILELA
jgi:hypothetical protein